MSMIADHDRSSGKRSVLTEDTLVLSPLYYCQKLQVQNRDDIGLLLLHTVEISKDSSLVGVTGNSSESGLREMVNIRLTDSYYEKEWQVRLLEREQAGDRYHAALHFIDCHLVSSFDKLNPNCLQWITARQVR